MLTYACSRSRPNAIIERTNIGILAWKLHFSSAAAAAQRRALPWASFGLATLDWRRRRRGSVVGAGTIVPPRHVPQEEVLSPA